MKPTTIKAKDSFTAKELKGVRRGIDFLTGKLLSNTEALGQISEDDALSLYFLNEFKSRLSNFTDDLEHIPGEEAKLIFLGQEE